MSAEHLSGFLQWLDRTLARESLVAATDQELLERFLSNRDDMAFRIIIARHGPMVYRVCRQVLPDNQDTDDAFQTAFLVLIRKAGSIRKRMSLASWLHGAAYQVSLRIRTGALRRRRREDRAGGREQAIGADDRSWSEVRAILDEELTRLPEQLRAPLVLCYLEGLTQDEAARQLGQTKRRLRRYLKRGRALLGVRLTRRGLAMSGALMTNLISDCVAAMPPGLATATEALSETIRTGKSSALSHRISALSEEVIKTMFPIPLNSKWIAATLLGACLGTVGLGSLLVEGQSNAQGAFVSETEAAAAKMAAEPRAFPHGPALSNHEQLPEGVDLKGTIRDIDQKPVAGAMVLVWTAAEKKGYSTFCPSCYADCGKRTTTDAKGAFSLNGLDRELRFQLLVVRDGFAPAFIDNIDPLERAVSATLSRRERPQNSSQLVRGRVVDTKGEPIQGAVIAPETVTFTDEKGNKSGLGGAVNGLDPLAVSNDKGEFEVAYDKPAVSMGLMVSARGMARKRFVELSTGEKQHVLTVSTGATIRGRLMHKGKPVAGAEIGLMSKERGAHKSYREERIGTKRDGTFVFSNVPSITEWYVYTKMASILQLGATDAIEITTKLDGEISDLGDIEIKPGHRFRGQVVLTDGKPIPKGMRILVGCERAWDYQNAVLQQDGRFEFVNLPTDDYFIDPSIKGYRLSTKNPNLSWVVEGAIDRDIDDFVILLDKGDDDFAGRVTGQFKGKALQSATKP